MKKRRSLGLAILATMILSLMVAAGIYAADMPDVIKMKAPYEHTKSEATFTHKKHVDEYKVGCGDCHHDDQGKPLTNLKAGDPVQKCFECHNKPGELKGKKAEGLSDKEKLSYHANALHQNCIDCHKKFNKEKNTKAAPQTCTGCHPKE